MAVAVTHYAAVGIMRCALTPAFVGVVQLFAKAPLGSDGIGRVSAGVILDRHFEL